MIRRLLGVAVAVVCLLTAAATAAPAATHRRRPPTTGTNTKPPPNQPIINSWALAPTGRDPSQPSSRIYLSYDVAPGATLQDSVTLWNYSNVQLTFQIYATDAFNNTRGAFDLLTAEKRPTDAGAWVKLPQPNITVDAHTRTDIPFTLTVPADARAGDHAGAVLAANQVAGTGPNGKVVVLDRRTGSRLYVRVSGALHPALVIENLHTVYHPSLNPFGGSVDVTYTVRNAGNARLSAHQRIGASGLFALGGRHRTVKDVPELLPGNAITLHEHFGGVSASLRARTDVELRPFADAPDVKADVVHRSGRTWAMPWSVLALALILWLAWKAYIPMRRRRLAVPLPSGPIRERLSPVP